MSACMSDVYLNNNINNNIIDFNLYCNNLKCYGKTKRKSKKSKKSDLSKLIPIALMGAATGAVVATGGIDAITSPSIVVDENDNSSKIIDFKDYVNNKQKELLNRLQEMWVDGVKMFYDPEENVVYDSDSVEVMFNELGNNNRYGNLQASGESKYGNFQVVDLSSHNGDVDFNKLKNDGVDACIIRMFDAWNMNYEEDNLSCLDSKFCEYAEKADECNIPFGAYIYSRATTEDMARQEAYKFLKFAAKYNIRPTFPVYYDIESQAGEPLYTPDNKTVSSVDFIQNNPEQVIKNFKAFAEVLEENGYYVGIYSGDHVLSTIDPNGDKLEDYSVWLARYYYSDTRCDFEHNTDIMEPNYKGNIGLYQFSSTGKFNGTNSNVDCSYCKYNYAKAIEKHKLNVPLDYEKNDFKNRSNNIISLPAGDGKEVILDNQKVLRLVD